MPKAPLGPIRWAAFRRGRLTALSTLSAWGFVRVDVGGGGAVLSPAWPDGKPRAKAASHCVGRGRATIDLRAGWRFGGGLVAGCSSRHGG